MPKNIILLCDGTSNEIARNRTNILRLYGCLKKDEHQLVFYDPGVGTFGAENAWLSFWRRAVEIWGLITGWGLDANVKEAYRFLVEHYDDGTRENVADEEPDRIYIIGFSRGAYTARVLAGFIHALGLIEARNLNLLNYAYRAYKNIGQATGRDVTDAREPERNPFAEVRLFERMLRPRRPAIRALGLFDTVGSVIEWSARLPRIRNHAHVSENPSVQSVRHALAIDERRTMYLPTPWPGGGEYWGGAFRPRDESRIAPQDVDEVWFSGVHGDVGGGYPEKRSQLAKFPLKWMIDELRPLGVKFKEPTVRRLVLGEDADGRYVAPDPLARPNESMTWGWKVVEFLPFYKTRYSLSRRGTFLGFYLPLCEYRHIPDGARVHGSVFARRGTTADYPQPNIPDDHVVVGDGDGDA
ncbi:T6SS phospholipase effector Tle1-like catalytic domain-containing protein [Roseovarius atlanticus]|uniref:T6SS phospholipase effector Tle1-like catalytic domain-containing protein n=1 Tax=Roseovarius atlanticus TaxID=1641875 RepID=UPI001C97E44B|nr:DUF2235 domain-containing protein [Roseovarius atlanticus]MBY5987962.1 DUF2235 domain-containing protein [Roseovarius atlanticus]MBY6123353.1 DUF2235 domain-containing protein [Roseovarius atlanticus]MBY6147848.1 DUF2235 domain-containing protein [Roseovarius atlanticus]